MHAHTNVLHERQVGSSFYKDYAGQTLAHRIAECGSVECAKLLLAVRRDCVRDVDKEGRTPLIWAAAYDNPLVLQRWLSAPETDPSHRSTSGKTALDFAVDMGHTECERLLRKHASREEPDGAIQQGDQTRPRAK